MKTINFWLSNAVFPTETLQFPCRIAGNVWHLAHNSQGNIVGFSGTNDNQFLLPLQVTQSKLLESPQLQATNGKMLDLLMSRGVVVLLDKKTIPLQKVFFQMQFSTVQL